MKRCIVAILSVFILAGSSAPSFAQMKDSPKVTLQVLETTAVGSATLKPGDYIFQCRHIDGKDYLVVTGTNGKEAARVPCKPENIEGKISQSDYRTVRREDGTKALSAVRIKGETVAHIVVND